MLIYMDNHPIPQDVTGFQFKLIGNMTVKQFAYLAVGTVLAILLYNAPIHALIKLPLSVVSAGLGLALAYLPIGGRPMDAMIGYYFKALIRPTVFVYDSSGFVHEETTVQPSAAGLDVLPKDRLKEYLKTIERPEASEKPKNKLDKKENDFLLYICGIGAEDTVAPLAPTAPNAALHGAAPQPPQPPRYQTTSQVNMALDDLQRYIEAQRMAANSMPKITFTEPVKPAVPPPTPQAPVPVKPKTEPVPAAKITTANVGVQAAAPTKTITKSPSVADAPSYPNLIVGITRDPRGNTLSNILVEIRDKGGNPVRAFKTNAIGRFASATPLANGTYVMEFEDPRGQNKFKTITINATGQIIMPIEATSVDTREELRRSLFAQNTAN
jgi:hypothetical protein